MTNDSISRRDVLAAAAAGAALAAGAGANAQPKASRSDDLTRLTIAEAGKRVAARTLSPVDLTRAYLERIEKLNPRVNAYITVTADAALAQARALDAELAAGKSRGPLHGIPLALKDNIDTAGVLTTAASAVYAQRVPSADAPVVTRLRDAGAVLLGKLNMHEFAYGGTCVDFALRAGAQPVEPRASRRAARRAARPPRSRRGSARARSARTRPRPIRFPAACCGVVGLKATHGLASIRGIVPLSEMHDHVGPLARSVEDCALIMDAISGFDPLDPVSIRVERGALAGSIGDSVAKLKIGVPRSPFFDGLDPEVATAVDGALQELKRMTAESRNVELPDVGYAYTVLGAETYEYHAKLVADPAKRALYSPVTLMRIESGKGTSADDYIAARRRMTHRAQHDRRSLRERRRARDADVHAYAADDRRVAREPAGRERDDPQHAAVRRARAADDQRAVRLHARGLADRRADHGPAARRGARLRARARVRAGDRLAPTRARVGLIRAVTASVVGFGPHAQSPSAMMAPRSGAAHGRRLS